MQTIPHLFHAQKQWTNREPGHLGPWLNPECTSGRSAAGSQAMLFLCPSDTFGKWRLLLFHFAYAGVSMETAPPSSPRQQALMAEGREGKGLWNMHCLGFGPMISEVPQCCCGFWCWDLSSHGVGVALSAAPSPAPHCHPNGGP